MGRRGFVLLIVVALISSLGVMAVTLLSQSSLNSKLTRNSLDRSRAMLLARSGVDYALSRKTAESIYLNAFPPSTISHWQVTPDAAVGHAVVEVQDSAGAININDGILGGQRELNASYEADAINQATDHAESSRINYRVRMLLNAYGDVHKLLDEVGSPQWPDDSATYTRPWTHSEGGKQGWNVAAPACPADSLGDKLLQARPPQGYRSMEEVKDLLNSWGDDNLSPGYLAGRTFFDIAEGDLTHLAPHDMEFHRLKTPLNITYQQFHTSTFNLNDGWVQSPVSLINMNHAGPEVRAAVFHAITDVRLLAYGATRFELDHSPLPMASQSDRHEHVSTLPPNFGPASYTNGAFIPLVNSDNGTNQGDRVAKHLISTRDALLLGKAWDDYTGSQEIIDSFPALERFLGWARVAGNNFYERMAVPAPDLEWPMRLAGKGRLYSRFSRVFGQHAPEVLLPRLLSGRRSLPGFMGAPAAMLHDYLQNGSLMAYHYEPLVTAEDFVPKGHLPKISFLGAGYLHVKSQGATVLGSLRKIRTTAQIQESTIMRSQADLASITRAETDSRVLIGPEWLSAGVPAHPLFGCIGLRDEPFSGLPPSAPHGCRLDFDGNLMAQGPVGALFAPEDPVVDPVNLNPIQSPLQNSQLEGPAASLFLTGNNASDLSPFGGILLSNRGHGFFAPGRFNDSLYWRPTSIMSPNTSPGLNFSKAYISFWYRVPHGNHFSHDNMVLFDATFWEKIELEAGATAIGHRPVRITCFLKPTTFEAGKNLHMSVWFQMIQTSFNNTGTIPVISGRTLPVWGSFMPLSHLPLPPPGLPPAFPLHPMGIPLSANVDVDTQWPEWFDRDITSHRYAVGGVFRPLGGSLHDDALSTPGVWNRVVLGWDLSVAKDLLKDRFWGAVTTAPQSVFAPVTNMTFTPPENNQMVISMGERHAITSSWLYTTAPYRSTFSPTFRLNSLIDNIDMRFGTTGPLTSQDDIPLLEFGTDSSRRYPLGLGWSTTPKLPTGARLIAVTTCIDDVPDLATGSQRNAPAISTRLEQGVAQTPPLYTSPGRPFTSKPVTTWIPQALTPDSRLRFTWSATDPSGNPVHVNCPDIPWITELQLLWSLPKPQFLSWEQE